VTDSPTYYTHVVSFDIKWENDADAYNKIHAPLQAAIKEDLTGSQWWAETTSFYIVRTTEGSKAMYARLWSAAKMRLGKDKLLVMNFTSKAGKAGGAIADQTLFSLVPSLK